MSLDEILAGIDAGAEAARVAFEADVAKQLAQMETTAAAARLRRKADMAEQQLGSARIRQLQKVHSARLEAAGVVASAREAILTEIWEMAGNTLAQCRAGPDYPALLGRLLAEAIAVFGPDPAVVMVDDRDAPLAGAWLRDQDVALEIRTEKNDWGGVRLLSEDGRIEVDNRLITRWRRLRHLLPALIGHDAFVPI